MEAKNGFQICYQIAKTDGMRGLFRGTGMSLLLFLPSSATWWGVSEAAKVGEILFRRILAPLNQQLSVFAETVASHPRCQRH
jgi:hypothetical protein